MKNPVCWGVRDEGVFVKVVNFKSSLYDWGPFNEGREAVPLYEEQGLGQYTDQQLKDELDRRTSARLSI